jgi:hypothetical protein
MTRRQHPGHPDNAEPEVDQISLRRGPAAAPQLILALRAVRLGLPCPWCGAQPGDPCRANQGRGPELTHYVHPARQPARPSDQDTGP